MPRTIRRSNEEETKKSECFILCVSCVYLLPLAVLDGFDAGRDISGWYGSWHHSSLNSDSVSGWPRRDHRLCTAYVGLFCALFV